MVNIQHNKELIQLNSKKSSKILKWMIDLNRHFRKEDIQMPIRYMNNCSTSLIIREMQVKTSVSYHHTLVRLVINKKTSNNKYWWGYGEKGNLCTVGGNVNWCSHYGKQYGVSSSKIKIEPLHDPAISLLLSAPQKWEHWLKKTYVPHRGIIYNSQEIETA